MCFREVLEFLTGFSVVGEFHALEFASRGFSNRDRLLLTPFLQLVCWFCFNISVSQVPVFLFLFWSAWQDTFLGFLLLLLL